MTLIYKLNRAAVVILTTMRNKLIMKLSGIRYGEHFRSCGRILYRNYAGRGG